ncbi:MULTISPECIES: TonB-dependent siderophore receptor [unclassified Flavobacterium]|uniref:TonB-dependent siderophore receptor n=1 Tax=unclassified Flavobacterium TaxID=196869 RepID=UPI000C1935F4|nr:MULTISPECIES: TonB-dependent siderophore receptor [unclassified Flavobacterium]PIF62113.1 iron complex outermembrane receptor protein [Flavobacterium sp. 11]RKS14961.1 iron complex outermembrane receptor protein [Flavobacterium sp. 120]
MKTINTFYLSVLLIGITVSAQEKKEQEKDSLKTLKEVIVNTNKYKYKREKSTTVSKMPLNNIENPQVYNTVTSELLKEQVVTNFNDALKNATGITRLWESTGRGGDGAEYFSMRGFAVQPTMINGLPGINNGSIDPANVDNIEVIKGPSGTLFGSSLISYGGLINTVTKKPYSTFGGEISYISGSYGLDRITADVNIPLNSDVAVRINTAYQKENSFQDAGFGKSFFFAPSLSYKVNDKLSFLINTEFTNRNSANAPMIFLSRYSPLSFNSIELFERNYKKSFTSNELSISNPTYSLQAQMFYKLSDQWTSQTVLSRSNSKTSGYYSYLFDASNGNDFSRYISKRNGETLATDIQQNFIGDFKIGSLRNRLVAGIDYYKSNIINGSTGWLGNGTVSLIDGSDTGDLTQAGVDNLLVGSFEGNSTAETEVISAYASNVLNITDKLSAMASLRIDNFKSKTATEENSQAAVSPKFGLVYMLIKDKVSVFSNYMNGFVNVTPREVSEVDGSNPRMESFDPEQANQYEFGLKTNLYKDIISASISYYNIDVKNRIMTDPNNINNSIQGGEVNSKGIELSFTANPVKGFNIIAGFSNNKSEVTKDNPGDGYLGQRPEEAGPETLVNFWANYTLTSGKLKGFGIGFGGNYASEYKTLNRANIGTFELPSYTVLNSALSYTSDKFNIALKLNNALNEKYYSGWSTVTPQRLRSVTAGLTYKF